MQNTSQAYRGAGAPGVNFSEHSYDNHIGAHCQPSGYQTYPNQPYHPLPSPRSHHYGNHQMQQNVSYRHHGGAYAPSQNQYGSNMNQDMYRNHSGYANNRNMSSKPWTDNSTSEMMSPYGQHSHPQMMNTPTQQIPVSTMRSPPHATSNMNPTPQQGQQHFRQMQSPAHSPHSWSQAQIPSPGVMHSSRTTPSPLSTHVRSPGHSQPFSPPTAHTMNMQPHPQPPENGQIPQPINSVGSSDSQNPSNPLHSLQKMVMLDQDEKAILPMMGEGNEQFANHCGPQNYSSEENINSESKDSIYSTYYNLDENRFESKPSGSNNAYSAVQPVSNNCNYPVHSHMVNSEEVQSNPILPNSSPNIPDCLQPDQSVLTSQGKNPVPVAHSQINVNLVQNDGSASMSECPPHAESAPVFTDQTKAAVSTNSEQALELKPDLKLDSVRMSSEETLDVSAVEKLNSSITLNDTSKNSEEVNQNYISEAADFVNQDTPKVQNSSDLPLQISKTEVKDTLSSDENSQCYKNIINPLKDSSANPHNPSNINLSNDEDKSEIEAKNDPDCNPDVNIKTESNDKQDTKDILSKQILNEASDNVPVIESDCKKLDPDKVSSKNAAQNSNEISKQCEDDQKSNNSLCHSSVKVVIHRVRKDDTNDIWHVPDHYGESSIKTTNTNQEKKSESKIPNVGPQIVILSPNKPERKFGFRSSVDENSITIKEEADDDDDVEISEVIDRTPNTSSESRNVKNENNSPGSHNSSRNSDKKRGRPVGSKNKIKPSGCIKKKKGRRGNKKKKFENSKLKPTEALPKNKKIKIFNGPYVHITGSKENPSSISVINVAQKEEEKVSKVPVKRSFTTTTANRIKKKPVGHLSTLSPTYDAFNRDKTWLCIFCHKGSHHGGLGDLYGPYYIKDKNYGSTKLTSTTSSSSLSSARSKKRKSDHDERASKKSKHSASHSVDSTPVNRNAENDSSNPDSNLKETWIHEDCAVWCQSISLFGEEVQGLEEAVTEAYENTCSKCSLIGATLGCWGKGCKELFHFSCAKEMDCQMDIENFSLFCPKHQKKSPDQHARCQ